MKTYAHIQDGRMIEVILPATYEFDSPDDFEPPYKAGDEIPIDQRFTPEFVATLVDITTITPAPSVGMVYDGTSFSEYVAPPPSAAEILATNTALRDALLSQATTAIAPLQDAVDLDMATDADVANLKAWKTYRVLVNRVDLTQSSPNWPAAPIG
jgi:hypothetical protein